MKTARLEAKILVRKLFPALDSVRGNDDLGCGDSSGAVSSDCIGDIVEKQIQQDLQKLTCEIRGKEGFEGAINISVIFCVFKNMYTKRIREMLIHLRSLD